VELAKIEADDVTIALDPRDCLRLAQACRAAEEALNGSSVCDTVFGLPAGTAGTRRGLGLAQLYGALGACFRAACVAAYDSYAEAVDRIEDLERDRVAETERKLLREEPPAAD
jgi:hypothetical protein